MLTVCKYLHFVTFSAPFFRNILHITVQVVKEVLNTQNMLKFQPCLIAVCDSPYFLLFFCIFQFPPPHPREPAIHGSTKTPDVSLSEECGLCLRYSRETECLAQQSTQTCGQWESQRSTQSTDTAQTPTSAQTGFITKGGYTIRQKMKKLYELKISQMSR